MHGGYIGWVHCDARCDRGKHLESKIFKKHQKALVFVELNCCLMVFCVCRPEAVEKGIPLIEWTCKGKQREACCSVVNVLYINLREGVDQRT